jgi:hypothetical protein
MGILFRIIKENGQGDYEVLLKKKQQTVEIKCDFATNKDLGTYL